MKTRDRILLAARRLFNLHGYGNVTIAQLAKELKMTKGNLWYHFNDKQSLLEALSEEFITLYDTRRKLHADPNDILESYVAFLNTVASEIREFRFLYRDQADYGEHTQSMLDQLPIIYAESEVQLVEFFSLMKQQGYLLINDAAIAPLAINVILVLRYNLEFMRERQLLVVEGAGAVVQTFQQHLSLFADKLSPAAIKYFKVALATHPAEKIAG